MGPFGEANCHPVTSIPPAIVLRFAHRALAIYVGAMQLTSSANSLPCLAPSGSWYMYRYPILRDVTKHSSTSFPMGSARPDAAERAFDEQTRRRGHLVSASFSYCNAKPMVSRPHCFDLVNADHTGLLGLGCVQCSVDLSSFITWPMDEVFCPLTNNSLADHVGCRTAALHRLDMYVLHW